MSRAGASVARPLGRAARGIVLAVLGLTSCILPQQDLADGPAQREQALATPPAPRPEVDDSLGFATGADASLPSDGPAPARDAHIPPTRLGLEVFADAELALVGRVQTVSRVGLGTGVLRVQVEERLMGDVRRGDELVVLGYATDFLPGSREILFLRRFRDGPRFEVTRRIDARDPDFAAKLDVTRRTSRLLDIRAGPDRDAAAIELVLDALDDRADWTRRYGLAELGWLASTRSDLFTPLRRARLEALAASTSDPDVRAGVESVTIALAPHPLSLPAPPRQESSSP